MLQVPIATRLLALGSTDLQDHSAWLLANIVCENCACVLQAGALPPLLKLLDRAKVDSPTEQSLIKTGTWLLSNLCQYTEDFQQVKECLPRLAKLIHSEDEGLVFRLSAPSLFSVPHFPLLSCFSSSLSMA